MSFTNHCHFIARKTNARANFILRYFLTLIVTFFYASTLCMLAPSWNITPHCDLLTSADISIFESAQKYFTKQLFGMESLTYDERFVALKFPSLSCRRNLPDLILLYKIMHNLIDTD